MAYFRNNEPPEEARTEQLYQLDDLAEEEYDDGVDELTAEEEPELTEEELAERSMNRFRLAAGAGNLIAVIGGAVLILILTMMIFSMVYFVINDLSRSFSLFQTHF